MLSYTIMNVREDIFLLKFKINIEKSRKIWYIFLACRCGGMVDTADSKSAALKACRFESDHRYHNESNGLIRYKRLFKPFFAPKLAKISIFLT